MATKVRVDVRGPPLPSTHLIRLRRGDRKRWARSEESRPARIHNPALRPRSSNTPDLLVAGRPRHWSRNETLTPAGRVLYNCMVGI